MQLHATQLRRVLVHEVRRDVESRSDVGDPDHRSGRDARAEAIRERIRDAIGELVQLLRIKAHELSHAVPRARGAFSERRPRCCQNGRGVNPAMTRDA